MTHQGLGRRFWSLWSAFASSNLGDGLTLVGVPLLAVSLTDDARLVAVVAALRVLPFLVVGLPAGVLIDRSDRRNVAMVAQLGRTSALAAIVVSIVTDNASIALLAAAGFVVGTGEVFTDGGLPAVVRDVVRPDQLEVANSRLRASETVANSFIGPPVGALLFQWDPAFPFIGAAVLYLFTVGLLSNLSGSFKPDVVADDVPFAKKMTVGVRYVWGHSILRPLVVAVAAFSFVGQASSTVFVLLATERLGLSATQFGFLLTVDAVASVVMSFLVARLVKRTSHGFSMQLSVACYAVGSFIYGISMFMPFVLVAIFLHGVSDPTWNVVSSTVRQRLVDDQIFGRMMTAYLFIAWSMQPVGSLFGGLVAETYGPEWVYVVAAVVVGSLLVFARPLYGRINAAMAAAT